MNPAVIYPIVFYLSPEMEYWRFDIFDFSPVSKMINELFLVRNFADETGESEFRYTELDLTFANVLV